MELWRTYRRPPDLLWRLAPKCKGERQEEEEGYIRTPATPYALGRQYVPIYVATDLILSGSPRDSRILMIQQYLGYEF